MKAARKKKVRESKRGGGTIMRKAKGKSESAQKKREEELERERLREEEPEEERSGGTRLNANAESCRAPFEVIFPLSSVNHLF
jgi:hypothetical protein